MAERRMFAKTIIDSDAFLDMPLSTQALYFHLSMRADDDGFINNSKKLQRMIGASDDDLKILMAKNFIIPFETGIVVIKHWKIHNYIRNDRYKETVYKDEKSQLETKENNAYTIGIPNDNQTVHQMDTQVRLGKDRLGKDRLGKDRLGKDRLDKDSIDNVTQCVTKNNVNSNVSDETPTPKVKHKYGEYNNVLLTDEELEKLKEEYSDVDNRIERLSEYIASSGKKYKSHYATIRVWAKKDVQTEKPATNYINKNTKAKELDDFYKMAQKFGEEEGD